MDEGADEGATLLREGQHENGLHTYIIKNTAVQQHGAKTKPHTNCGQ